MDQSLTAASSAALRIDFVQPRDNPRAGVLPRHAQLRLVPPRGQSPKDLDPVLVRQGELAGMLEGDAVPEVHGELRPLGSRQLAGIEERMRHGSKHAVQQLASQASTTRASSYRWIESTEQSWIEAEWLDRLDLELREIAVLWIDQHIASAGNDSAWYT